MNLKKTIWLATAAAIAAIVLILLAFRLPLAGWAKVKGIENFSTQDFEKAQTYLGLAKLLNGNDGETHAYLGHILVRQERFEAALAEFQRAEALNFKNGGFFQDYGWTLRNLNQPQKAVEYYEKAFPLAAPGLEQNSIAQQDLMPLYFQLGNNEKVLSEGRELLNRLSETDEAIKIQVTDFLARVLTYSGQEEEAINLLSSSISEVRNDPLKPVLYGRLALAYLKSDRFAEAEKAAKQALAIAPEGGSPYPYCILGAIYFYHQKDYNISKKYLESGLRVRPISSDNAYCVYLMGRLEKELGGHMDLAKQYFNEFLSLPIDFTVPEFKLLKERIEGFLKEITG